MAVIDADAHVLENNRTWEYMEGAEKAYRPQIVTSTNDAGESGEYWLVDGRLFAKSDNVGEDTPEESREMSDITSRLRQFPLGPVGGAVLEPNLVPGQQGSRPRDLLYGQTPEKAENSAPSIAVGRRLMSTQNGRNPGSRTQSASRRLSAEEPPPQQAQPQGAPLQPAPGQRLAYFGELIKPQGWVGPRTKTRP